LDINMFDAVLTDAHDLVPWATSVSPLHYIDTQEYPHQPGRELFERKRGLRSFSILVPQHPETPELQMWMQEAFALMPDHVYVDDGTAASRRPAFEGYGFSVLLSLEASIPPVQVLESVAYATVPMLVWTVPHFINYTVYFPYMVGKLRPDRFSIDFMQGYMQNVHEDAIYVMQNSLMLVQDFFYFRYRLSFPQRISAFASRLCEEAALPSVLRTDVFIAIYSAKPNFPRRRAIRETWLTLLTGPTKVDTARPNDASGEAVTTSYKFFVNAIGAGDPSDPASAPIDDLLRAEADAFGDLVFVDALEEYPIGNMGRMALHWIANHTSANYVLKLDDDMYIRPLPLLRHLVRQQRAMMYWGFFERSGQVVRDQESAHYLPDDLFGHDGVFPPYARGAALAMSLDLVRLIVHFDRRGMLRRLKVEDASYGYFLWQLVVLGITSVTLADNEEARFALDPKCCTEKSHPNNCWSPLSDGTWIVHHVGPRAIRCMFRTDLEAGYYLPRGAQAQSERQCFATAGLAHLLPSDDSIGGPDGAPPQPCAPWVAAAPVPEWAWAYDPKRSDALPSQCGCVYTAPPHPGQPVPGPMYEGADGPRLHK